MTLGQQSSLLSAGYGFSVWGEYLGTSESTVAHVQHASDVSPGRITERGIFMLRKRIQKTSREKVFPGLIQETYQKIAAYEYG